MEAKHQRCDEQFGTEEPAHQLDDASFAVARRSTSAHLPAAGAAALIDIVHRGCHFLFNDPIGMPEEVYEAVANGISLVWNKHVGQLETFNICIAHRVSTPRRQDIVSCYDPDNDTLYFSSVRVYHFLPGASYGARWLTAAAHEAMHKVQVHRGDNPAPSGSDPVLDDSPDEQEAWREALDVVKAVFPEAGGALIMAGRTYEVPETSTYRL